MGYYTSYKLDYEIPERGEKSNDEMEKFVRECQEKGVKVPDTLQKDIMISLEGRLDMALHDKSFCGYGPLMDFAIGNADSCKWYEHNEDMTKLSEMFPEVLFTLSGEGEKPGDLWKKYYKDGKCQVAKAKITLDGFDEKKLK